MRKNPDHSYGIKSDLATKMAPNISQVLNNDYLKEFLTDRIASKAIEQTHLKELKAKKGRNRAFKFRSGSVMNGSRVPNAVTEAEKAILKKAAMRDAMRSSMQTAQSE